MEKTFLVSSPPSRSPSISAAGGWNGEVAARWLRQLRRMAASRPETPRRRSEGGTSCSRIADNAAAACDGIGNADCRGRSGRLCAGELPRHHVQRTWHGACAPEACAVGQCTCRASRWTSGDACHAIDSDFDGSRGTVASTSPASEEWRAAGTCGGYVKWLARASS